MSKQKLNEDMRAVAEQHGGTGLLWTDDLLNWVERVAALEAKLEAMGRRIRILSRVMGSGLAYIEELRTDAGAEQRTWSRRREMWYESLAAAQQEQEDE